MSMFSYQPPMTPAKAVVAIVSYPFILIAYCAAIIIAIPITMIGGAIFLYGSLAKGLFRKNGDPW